MKSRKSGRKSSKKQIKINRNSMTLIDLDTDFTKDTSFGFKNDQRRATLFTFFSNKSPKPMNNFPVSPCLDETPNDLLMNSDVSVSKLNIAIQKLNTQPTKSILKKASDLINNSDDVVDTSMRFEHQVNINTIINSAVGTGHRSSRRSLTYDTKRGSVCSATSSSSDASSSSPSSSPNSSVSISSSLSKNNKHHTNNQKETELIVEKPNACPNLSFLTNTSSSRSSSSTSLPPLEAKSDFRKVQDYLNELNHLSQQNTFARLNPEINKSSFGVKINSDEVETQFSNITTMKKKPDSVETSSRPSSLLGPVLVNNRNSNMVTAPHTQTILQLQIMKPSEDVTILHSNTSETSSGYMSTVPKQGKGGSKESLFEADDYYSVDKKKEKVHEMKGTFKVTPVTSGEYAGFNSTPQPSQCLNTSYKIDKQFSTYSLVQANNHLNIHS